jgi:integrase
VRDITGDRLSYYVAKRRKEGIAESTISTNLGHLRAALGYAFEWGYLAKLPELPRQQRAKASKMMKGRPITGEEFDRMLAATTPVVGPDAAPSWERLLRGLWLSGLRLTESLTMSWDEVPGVIVIDLSGRRPMFRVPAEAEKGNRDRLLPVAPEFAEFLLATPEADRTGSVFKLEYRRKGRGKAIGMEWVSAVVSRIGKRANVVVNTETGKTASAHDLRRAFGQRWAARVMPAILQQLMRHADITTTLKYYVGSDAQATADVLWEAVAKLGTNSGTTAERIKLGN